MILFSIYSRCHFSAIITVSQRTGEKYFPCHCRDCCILLRHWTSAESLLQCPITGQLQEFLFCLNSELSWNCSTQDKWILKPVSIVSVNLGEIQMEWDGHRHVTGRLLGKTLSVQKTCTVRNSAFFFLMNAVFWLLNSSILLEQRVWGCWASWICHPLMPAWLARTGWKRVLPC